MEDLSHECNLLDNCETSYFENINKSHQVDKICSKMRDQTLQYYDADLTEQNHFRDFLDVTQSSIESNIDDNVTKVIYHRARYL